MQAPSPEVKMSRSQVSGVSRSPPNFTASKFVNKVEGFDNPTKLPTSETEHARWQSANKAWWEATPMRYDWREGIVFAPGTREYYREIDRRFFASARQYLPWKANPFDQLVPYADLSHLDVLEIGVGQGTHAQLISPRAKSFTGIDLTEAAQQATSRRLEIFGIPGRILQMDAEAMSFPDASFDFIWSWGVIHHSADTRRVLTEMSRVLRPGGRATVMVYHRNWWNFFVVAGALKGLAQGQLKQLGDLHSIAQGATDGAIARYYKPAEWREITRGLFDIERLRILGLKNDVIPLPPGKLKSIAERATPSILTRMLTNTMRMGSFLVAQMRKP
jgi:ubiquinone/menaquinone biosynthesis C-methylase UbiE